MNSALSLKKRISETYVDERWLFDSIERASVQKISSYQFNSLDGSVTTEVSENLSTSSIILID